MEIVKELPEISKEIETQKEKENAQRIKGNVTLTVDGITKTLNNWNAATSSIRFFNHKNTYILRLDANKKAYFGITMTHKSLWPDPAANEYASTMHTLDFSDQAFLEKLSNGYIHLTYTNEAANEKYETYKGTVTLHSWSEDAIKITFEGEGFVGDWKERTMIPMKIDLDLSHNFTTADKRTSK